jgi:hypothetical protein
MTRASSDAPIGRASIDDHKSTVWLWLTGLALLFNAELEARTASLAAGTLA